MGRAGVDGAGHLGGRTSAEQRNARDDRTDTHHQEENGAKHDAAP
jgi:hypothetical protein